LKSTSDPRDLNIRDTRPAFSFLSEAVLPPGITRRASN
jgi:hypothetical protein